MLLFDAGVSGIVCEQKLDDDKTGLAHPLRNLKDKLRKVKTDWRFKQINEQKIDNFLSPYALFDFLHRTPTIIYVNNTHMLLYVCTDQMINVCT